MALPTRPDEYYMLQALELAQQALEEDEIPIGAVVVARNRIIARGYNQTEKLKDVSAHAEMICLTAAANYLGGKYLKDCTLYVTVEPCPMCAGALYWAQLGRLVYGTGDPKRGYSVLDNRLLHPKTEVRSGVLAEEAASLLHDFFTRLR